MRQRIASLKPTKDFPQLTNSHTNERPPTEGKTWYSISVLNRTETEVFIYDEIGGWGVTASDFIKEFNAIKSNVSLRINSPGGDVFDGIAIYNAVKRHDSDVNVYVDGLAASAASFIAMAGDTVTMSPKSQLMVHDAYGIVMGPADDMRQMADMLDKTSDNIASIYAERAGGEVEEWRERMRAETWLSDREAVALGLADGIDGEEGAEDRYVIPVEGGGSITITTGTTTTSTDDEPVFQAVAAEEYTDDSEKWKSLFDEIADELSDEDYSFVGG